MAMNEYQSFKEKIKGYMSDIHTYEEDLNSTIRHNRLMFPQNHHKRDGNWWEDVLYFNVLERNIEVYQYNTVVNKYIMDLHIVYNDYTVNRVLLDSNEDEQLRVEELRQEIEEREERNYRPLFK